MNAYAKARAKGRCARCYRPSQDKSYCPECMQIQGARKSTRNRSHSSTAAILRRKGRPTVHAYAERVVAAWSDYDTGTPAARRALYDALDELAEVVRRHAARTADATGDRA